MKQKNSVLFHVTEFGQRVSKSVMDLIGIISKPRLKVALISYHYQKPTISGVGIHVQNLAKYLTKHNCNVHVFCSGEEDAIYKEGNVIVHTIGRIHIPLEDEFSRKRLIYDIFESEIVKEITRENSRKRFDIIHTHGTLTKSAFIIKKVYGIKWVHTFHSIEKLRVKKLSDEEKHFADLISWIERTVNHCDGAIFVSKELMDECVKHYRMKSKIMIPNGIDLELFSYYPITKKNVLFVGRFSKEKGVGILPELITNVMSVKDATFTIVSPHREKLEGEGELSKIKKLIDKQKKLFEERLTVIERLNEQEFIGKLYRECQVYIQPSKYESFGLCILEAMATGRPVVAFKVGGIPEVIGNAGFAVKDKKELIYKVKELLNDKKQSIIVGRKASQRAKGFDWNVIAKKTIKYYEEVGK